jgi:5'-deoxynucleotidase
MNPVRAYLSGSVQRWHMNPALARTGQTDADHQGRCVHLLLVLHPCPSAALIRAVATHDGGELDAGDLSYDFKRQNPGIAAGHAAFEDVARQAIFGPDPDLTLDEARWVKLIDRLEGACWVLVERPEHYRRVIRNEVWIMSQADDLGCLIAVRGLLHDLKGGLW